MTADGAGRYVDACWALGLLTGGWWDVSGGCRRRVSGAVGGIRQAMLHLIIKPGLGKTGEQGRQSGTQ